MTNENELKILSDEECVQNKIYRRITNFNLFFHPIILWSIFILINGATKYNIDIIGYNHYEQKINNYSIALFLYLLSVLRLIGVPILVIYYIRKGKIEKKYYKKILSDWGWSVLIILLISLFFISIPQ